MLSAKSDTFIGSVRKRKLPGFVPPLAAKPATKPAAKPAAEPAAKPAAEPAAKPAAEHTGPDRERVRFTQAEMPEEGAAQNVDLDKYDHSPMHDAMRRVIDAPGTIEIPVHVLTLLRDLSSSSGIVSVKGLDDEGDKEEVEATPESDMRIIVASVKQLHRYPWLVYYSSRDDLKAALTGCATEAARHMYPTEQITHKGRLPRVRGATGIMADEMLSEMNKFFEGLNPMEDDIKLTTALLSALQKTAPWEALGEFAKVSLGFGKACKTADLSNLKKQSFRPSGTDRTNGVTPAETADATELVQDWHVGVPKCVGESNFFLQVKLLTDQTSDATQTIDASRAMVDLHYAWQVLRSAREKNRDEILDRLQGIMTTYHVTAKTATTVVKECEQFIQDTRDHLNLTNDDETTKQANFVKAMHKHTAGTERRERLHALLALLISYLISHCGQQILLLCFGAIFNALIEKEEMEKKKSNKRNREESEGDPNDNDTVIESTQGVHDTDDWGGDADQTQGMR